ncbi:hypothetical protein HHK36_029794 [Tetracentron sinense]|uniref:Bowman-Birk serine protease inhibitors family domain-containing protein n=1 Tax=Tetracentron sinense TaxID=13715 RepID=A0A834YBZ1_TETSI|nr:hypothetical protein HHK36_029794 [Tetracentron sinense]
MKTSYILMLIVALVLSSFGCKAMPNTTADKPITVLDGNELCCNTCVCAYSNPPQCRCTDVKSYCHQSCKACACTKSIPPQCHCMDIKASCEVPCQKRCGEPPKS